MRNTANSLRITEELITRLGEHTLITDVTRPKVKALADELKMLGNSQSTINTKMSILSRLMNMAADDEIIEDVPKIPWKKIPRGRVRVLTADEEDSLMANLPDKSYWFASFLITTGARPGETMDLIWSNIDLSRNDVATVTFEINKTDNPRTIPLMGRALEAVQWTKAQGWTRPFSEVVYSTFTNHWKKAKEAAGITDPSVIPYTMRHTAATRLGKSGEDTLIVKKWLGHSRVSTTEIYTHFDVDDLIRGAKTLAGGSKQRGTYVQNVQQSRTVLTSKRHIRPTGGKA
jgi:integrase